MKLRLMVSCHGSERQRRWIDDQRQGRVVGSQGRQDGGGQQVEARGRWLMSALPRMLLLLVVRSVNSILCSARIQRQGWRGRRQVERGWGG